LPTSFIGLEIAKDNYCFRPLGAQMIKLFFKNILQKDRFLELSKRVLELLVIVLIFILFTQTE
jgi:hypothetical protein